MAVLAQRYVIRGLAPDGVGEQEFVVDQDYVRWVLDLAPAEKYFYLDQLHDVLPRPAVIFQGLQRADFEKALCYSCVPPGRWNGVKLEPPPPGEVFVAYAKYVPETETWEITDCDWVIGDPRCPGHPEDWETRFTRRLWSKT